MDKTKTGRLMSVYNRIYTPTVREIGRVFFYIALFCEIVIFILDRADWINPYQSMMFRVTFVLFLVKCVCTKYTPREWAFIILTAAFCIFAYSISIKDEIIRAMVFIIAMKDIDVKRALKFNYILTIAGSLVLVLLAALGVMGELVAPYGYGEKADLFMLSLGLGSSNTLGIQIWLFVALGIYLYHDRLSAFSYVLIAVLGVVVYFSTHCRTAVLMIFFSALLGFVFKVFPGLAKRAWVYVSGGLITLVCLGLSIYSAKVSAWLENETAFQQKLDRIFTGRIASLCAFENGGAVLENWTLFSSPDFNRYIDMGFVRLFWWYGIIPGALAMLSVLILFAYQYRRRDYAGFILTLSVVVFTLVEAHFVSPFIARAYLLFLAGGAWVRILGSPRREPRHVAFYIGSLNKGGAERVFVNLAEYFLSVGYAVTFITQYKYEDEYDLPEGAERVISDISEEECRGRIYNFCARILKLHGIIRRTDADLLMTTIGKANFMAVTCAAFLPTRVVVSIVADPPLEYPTRIMRILLQTLFGEADGIIMQTHRQQAFLRRGLRRVSVILPNSVSPAFVKERFDGERKHDIYVVGRMDGNKNQAMAISAFGKAATERPDFRLVVCGDGPDRGKLVELAETCGIADRVDFPGIVSDVPDRLYDAYAFLLPSDTEGMPNTLLEAMSLGLPCISTDCPCGGPAELIVNGENGILTGVRDTDAFAVAIRQIIEDPEYAERLGKAAYETMLGYRPETVNQRWREYFDSIMDR